MRETMESMLDADRPLGSSTAARQDRPRVKPITVMVTASGAPGNRGAPARAARERRARGAARRHRHERALGRPSPLRCVPPRPGGSDPAFPDAMLEIAEREHVDAILPQSSFDLEGLAAHVDRFPMPVLVSKPDAIQRSNDKAETYALLHRLGVPRAGVPARQRRRARWRRRRAELGYPERPVCFKPVFSSGSRGFRILDPTVDRAHQLLNERPGSVAMRLEEAVELLPAEGGPDLLVMELAIGGERTIDGIANGREIVLGHPKTREAMRAGLAMYFVTLDDPELMRDRQPDRRRARDRALLQHPARRRARDRDQPADLDDRLPGRPEPAVPGREARARRDLRRRAARRYASRIRPGRTALRYFDQLEFD